MSTQKYLIAAVILGGCSIPASAALTTYSTLSAFQAATSTDTFSNIAFAQGNLFSTSTSDLGVDFSTSGPDLMGVANISSWPAGTALVSTNSSGGNTLTITLPSAVDAISLYIGLTTTDSNIQISVADNGGAPDTFSASPTVIITSPYYLGIVTDASFTTFTIQSFGPSDHVAIDDMEIGQAQAQTPEVATLLLVGTGLLAMGYFRRRGLRTPQPATA
jgi:hypothetical protein